LWRYFGRCSVVVEILAVGALNVEEERGLLGTLLNVGGKFER